MGKAIVGKRCGRLIETDPGDRAAERLCANGAGGHHHRAVLPHEVVDLSPPTRGFRTAPGVAA